MPKTPATRPRWSCSRPTLGPLIVPTLVITEVVYLLAARLGTEPEVRFLGDLAAGAFTLLP